MSESQQYRPTLVTVNLAHLENNVNIINSYVKGKKICAIVKADAYGHGVYKVTAALQHMQIYSFGVSYIEEAIYLRNIGIKKPIIIIGGVYNNALDAIQKYDLTPVLGGQEQLEMFVAHAIEHKTCFNVHLEIDTGMARLGVPHADVPLFIEKAMLHTDHVNIVGIMTHLASTYISNSTGNNSQIERFINSLKYTNKYDIYEVHFASSSTLVAYESVHNCCNMVRCGSLLYGIQAFDSMRINGLKPIMTLHTKIIALRKLLPGSPVGYNGSYVTPVGYVSCIATISIGFADGYRREFSNRGMVLIHNTRVPIVGHICMDMCMADVSSINNPKIGDDVVLIGVQGNTEISIEELASWANTVSSDIICNIAKSIQRRYVY